MVVNLILESDFSSYKQNLCQATTSLVGDKNLKERCGNPQISEPDQLLVTESSLLLSFSRPSFLSVSGTHTLNII